MTVRAMDKDDQLAALGVQRQQWHDWAAYLRRRGGEPDAAMSRRLMLDLEDAVHDLDDVIGNIRMERRATAAP